MRFPENRSPAVACYRNGVIVSCVPDAAFVIDELIFMRTLTGVDVLPGI